MTKTAQPIPPALPLEVHSFAAEQAVAAYLPSVLEMTRRIFADAQLSVVVEDDPEIPHDRHIVLIVKAKGLDVAQALAARWEWHRELFACCPAPLVCVFRLGLELGR